ncbi:hypothetical protein [Afipia felis]|uniref:hypothetical protein n=1 Tax=Afipia felis TaxID=1035 RepID=UPI0032E03CC7
MGDLERTKIRPVFFYHERSVGIPRMESRDRESWHFLFGFPAVATNSRQRCFMRASIRLRQPSAAAGKAFGTSLTHTDMQPKTPRSLASLLTQIRHSENLSSQEAS